MEPAQYLTEDEIDLWDYFKVLFKRKILVLSIFLLALVTAAIVSFLMPKVYEISSTIQLGSINDLLIKREEAKEIILNKNALLSIIKELNLNIDAESLKKCIKVEDITNTNLLKISMKYSDIDNGIKIDSLLPSLLILQGQNISQQRTALINERLMELESEIKNVQENIVKTQNLITGISTSNDASQTDKTLKIILLQNTLPNYENNLTTLRNQKNEIKVLFANSREFKVFDAPIKPKYAIGPKKKQNVLIAGIISLFFGLFLAFFIEFLQKCKKEN